MNMSKDMSHSSSPPLMIVLKGLRSSSICELSLLITCLMGKLSSQIEDERNPLSTIIRGVEELWDISLLMFIYELTTKSVHTNVAEFGRRGFLEMDAGGVPQGARDYIEELFEQASRNPSRGPGVA